MRLKSAKVLIFDADGKPADRGYAVLVVNTNKGDLILNGEQRWLRRGYDLAAVNGPLADDPKLFPPIEISPDDDVAYKPASPVVIDRVSTDPDLVALAKSFRDAVDRGGLKAGAFPIPVTD